MKPQVIQVQGTSMYPFIKGGDYVIIEPCPLREAQIGDVVAVTEYNGRDKLYVHRLAWKTHHTLLIKGDSISSFSKVRTGRDGKFLGKVTSIIRNNKTIAINNRWLNSIKLLLSLSLIPWQIIKGH